MPSPPLESTHGRTTSGVACHHRLWAAHTVEQSRAWHAIVALRLNTRSNVVKRNMSSPPLDSTHGRTTSGVACHHRLLAAHTVERRRAWHDITALGWHAWSNDVRRRITSPPLDSTHGRQHRAWHDITALGQHTQLTTSGVACHHRPLTAHTVGKVGRGIPSPP